MMASLKAQGWLIRSRWQAQDKNAGRMPALPVTGVWFGRQG